MTTIERITAVCAALLLGVAAGAAAQTALTGGATASIPTEGFGDVANTGYSAFLGGSIELTTSGLSVDFQGFWGRIPHETSTDRSYLYGATAGVGYRFASLGEANLEGWVGLSGMVHRSESDAFPALDVSHRGLAISVGPRGRIPIGRVSLVGFVTYGRGLGKLDTAAYPTRWVTVGAGLTVPLGSLTE